MAGQLWSTNNLGGYMSSEKLSRVLRFALQPLVKFRQFADIKDAAGQGKNKGDSYQWNVYSDVATQGTTLAETDVMPETNFTIAQRSLTITEMGNSVPYTGKLDDLSEHPVTEIINKVLKNDAKKAFDAAAYAQFNATPLRVAPTGGTSTNAVTLSTNAATAIINNVAMGKDHVKAIVDIMKERNIPAYVNDDYISMGHPTTFRQLKNDLEAIHQYVDTGFQMILNGEIGSSSRPTSPRRAGRTTSRTGPSSSAPTPSPRRLRCPKRCAARSRPTTAAAVVWPGTTWAASASCIRVTTATARRTRAS